MRTLIIEIPEKVEKTFCDLVELLGGRVTKTGSDQKLNKEINKKPILNVSEKLMSFHKGSKVITDKINGELDAIIFMKFGCHAEEKEDDIVVRKRLEFKKAGKIFWGYGGNVCHPGKQVQEFVKDMRLKGKKVFLAMSSTNSKSKTKSKLSLKFSYDNSNWNDVPDGIEVQGSKYAIVCYDLIDCNISLNLNNYEVAVGPKVGKRASEYIKGQNDKGCLIKTNNEQTKPNKITISLLAEIVEPYAVFMK